MPCSTCLSGHMLLQSFDPSQCRLFFALCMVAVDCARAHAPRRLAERAEAIAGAAVPVEVGAVLRLVGRLVARRGALPGLVRKAPC